jgi:hypothetical protein
MAVTVQLTLTGQLLRPEPSRVPQQTRMVQLPLRQPPVLCQPPAPTHMEQLPLGQRPQPLALPILTQLHRLRLLQHQQPRRRPSTKLLGYGHSRLAGCFNILPASFICQLQ